MSQGGRNDFSSNIAAFCASLRAEYHFAIGHAQAHDALRALEAVGIADEDRVRTALRLVCCGNRNETLVFERAFDAFFRGAPGGAPQPAYAPRHTRPDREKTPPRDVGLPAERPKSPVPNAPESADGGKAVKRTLTDEDPSDATTWQTLRARYSPLAAQAQPPQLRARDHQLMLSAASRVIASVRLGRSRRWKSIERGGRFDLRRTIRASLQTGGDPVDLRFLGHPLRNPRFVVLIDGSRSMSEHTGAIVRFARALCERSSRANVFFFSTELREVTRALRAADVRGGRLADVGEAWGGGTKIGAILETFVAEFGMRLLSPDTVVVICSDGLDAGDLPRLERAMRTIDRRSAAIVWLNPYAAEPGYQPTARGMRAALPFLTLLTAANDARGFAAARAASRAKRPPPRPPSLTHRCPYRS